MARPTHESALIGLTGLHADTTGSAETVLRLVQIGKINDQLLEIALIVQQS